MNAEKAIYLAQALNMFALVALAIWFVVPKLRNTGRAKALMALTSVHLGRTLCLEIYSSQDAGMKMANNIRDQIVVGDPSGVGIGADYPVLPGLASAVLNRLDMVTRH